jgi:hypothetical protein
MAIDYSTLNFTFFKKPLLVGGKAMEYYDLRKAGDDIDFVVTKDDLGKLVEMYPHNLKDLWGDLGIAVHGFEIWKSIDYFDYDYLSQDALEESNYLVISLEKLLLQKAMAMQKPKYHKDLELVVKKITDNQYSRFDEMKSENEKFIKNLEQVTFVEKVGPDTNS